MKALALALAAVLAATVTGAPAAPPPADRPPGTLDALGTDGQPRGACPLEHTDVQVQVSGFVARVVVTQRFANPFPDPVEAVYTFPLSERAAVDAMTIRAGDRTVRGEIKPREEARRIYEAAKAAGQLAAVLDQERPNIFTQSLANLVPGASVEVRIEYVEPLAYADGGFEFAFPTVVGPRFIPGAATGGSGTGWAPDTDRVPDASRITPPVAPPGTRAGHDLSLAVDIDAGVPIGAVTAPLHQVDVERPDAARARVRLRRHDEIPNRDVVIRWAVADDDVRSGYLVQRDEHGDGFVTFLLLPPKRVTAATAAPKELIFVIDRSGSQMGAPLEKAKETMLWILDHMHPNDTFQVIDFGSSANVLFPRPERATPAMRARARAHIRALEANGGTMIADAIRTACAQPADGGRLRVVTFMTDGYIGNDFEAIDLVRQLRGTSRWFLFGTGNSVNRFVLDGMARAGGGEVDYVLLADRGETIARRFWERIANPALTDVSLEFRGLDVVDVLPQAPADVWDRRPLVVHARYRTPGRGQVILHGRRGGAPWTETLDVTLPAEGAAHGALGSMWARAKVDALMDQDLAALQRGEFPAPLREEIVRVALAHRIVTQFTSFVAVEDRVVNEGGVARTVTVPVELPDGVKWEGVFGSEDAEGRAALPRSLAMAGGALAAARPMPAGPPLGRQAEALADRFEVVEERDATPPPMDEAVRGRLAPEVLALLEGRPSPLVVRDGWVRVTVRLREAGPAALARLAAAGFQLSTADGVAVTGLVALDRLAALATQDGVVRIEAPAAS